MFLLPMLNRAAVVTPRVGAPVASPSGPMTLTVDHVTILPFRLHLLLAEYNPTFPCNPELLSSHIGLRLLEINLDLLST